MSSSPAVAVTTLGASLAIACLAATLGCAPRPPVEPSGVLGDYSEFERDPNRGETLRYFRPGTDLSRYDRVIIEPVQVAMADPNGSVDPEELVRLTRYLRAALVIAMRGAYPVVEEPGPRTLRLRATITDIIPTKPVLATTGTLLIPAHAASTAKRVATGTDLFVGQVAIEAELLESATNKRLVAIVDRKAGNNYNLKRGASTWGDIEQAFREWAVDFRRLLDRAHGN
jgi:hypothetical protein